MGVCPHPEGDSAAPPGGTLFVVATPIGNLDDMSPRAVSVLREVALVAAEDTRKAALLFTRHGISTPTTSFHDHNKEAMLPRLLSRLQRGQDLALISEAGTPGISDPGFYLVRAARRRDLPVMTVPGPSAVVAALSISGLPTDRFCFLGFPPRGDEIEAFLRDSALMDTSLVLYQAPGRILETLAAISRVLGQRQVSISREMTKIYEETVVGTPSSLAEHYRHHPESLRGEFTLIIAPPGYSLEEDGGGGVPPAAAPEIADVVAKQIVLLVDAGYRPADAARIVARGHRLPRSEVYRAYLDMSESR
ncbi:MAG: 16S rRNA (cytidine(1402)-2'-O)-methyltransferase [Bacillota bacterium]